MKYLILILATMFCMACNDNSVEIAGDVEIYPVANKNIGAKITSESELPKYQAAQKKPEQELIKYREQLKEQGYVWMADYDKTPVLVYVEEGITLNAQNAVFYIETPEYDITERLYFKIKDQNTIEALSSFSENYIKQKVAIIINGVILTTPVVQEKLSDSANLSGAKRGRDYFLK